MGLFDRVEKRIEQTINRTFARAFHSSVQPVEIASTIRRAMDERATTLSAGRVLVPNIYSVDLASSDFDQLNAHRDDLIAELIAAAQEHAESERYAPGGPFEIVIAEDAKLETGVFRVRPAVSKRTEPSYAGPAPVPAQADHSAYQRPQNPPQPGPAATPEPEPQNQAPSPDPASPARPEPNAAAYVPPAKPRVSLVDRPWLGVDGERYPLILPLTIVGRDASADIVLDDPGISRRHCELRVTTDGPHLVTSMRDLNATNGTFVNGERITSLRLADGDQITVGRTSVTFHAGRR